MRVALPLRRLALAAICLAVLVPPSPATAAPADEDWNGSAEQKIWGLMQVWSTVKVNLANFDLVPDLDWDAAVRAATPRVLAADNRDEYYRRLNELTALVRDGHTLVVWPTLMSDDEDSPALEFQMVGDRIVLARAGDTDENRRQNIRPGQELLAVDGAPAAQYLQEHALRYYPGSTPAGGRAFGMFLFLRGPLHETVRLTLGDAAGPPRVVTVTRGERQRDGSAFKFRIRDESPTLETRRLAGGIVYLKIATFGDEALPAAFDSTLDRLDPARIGGLILDLRYNMGGDDNNAYPLVSRLVEQSVLGSTWRTREYRPAFASWGQPEACYQGDTVRIEPSARPHYHGPLVVLIGPNTLSTAEDFLVPLDFAGRALFIGEATAGSTGNPVNVRLPGGGLLRVCSKRDFYPDGREFVGRGIPPDVAVQPTAEGIRAGRDEALNRAIEILRDWPRYQSLAAYHRTD